MLRSNFYPGVLLFPIILVLPFPLIVDSIGLAIALLNIIVVGIIQKDVHPKAGFREGAALILVGLFVFFLDWVTQVIRDGEWQFMVRESRISFLIIPLVISLAWKKTKQFSRLISVGLIIGVMLYILYAYVFLVYFYGTQANRSFALNHYLVYDLYNYLPGAYHHTYLGMYFTMAIFFAVEYYREKKKAFWIVIALFILFNQIFMGGKVTLIISVLFMAAFYMRSGIGPHPKRSLRILAATLVISLVGYLAIRTELWKSILFSFQNRIASWECSFEIIKEHWIAGIGSGRINQFLESCINSDALSSHNQYLEEVVYYGILGIWLPAFLFILLARAKGHRVYTQFLLLIIILALSENILSLQRGILFFVLYNTVFYLSTLDEKGEDLSFDNGTS